MAFNTSLRKGRRRSSLPINQKRISDFFTPKSGINKEDVNFQVKPVLKPNLKNPGNAGGRPAAKRPRTTRDGEKSGMSNDENPNPRECLTTGFLRASTMLPTSTSTSQADNQSQTNRYMKNFAGRGDCQAAGPVGSKPTRMLPTSTSTSQADNQSQTNRYMKNFAGRGDCQAAGPVDKWLKSKPCAQSDCYAVDVTNSGGNHPAFLTSPVDVHPKSSTFGLVGDDSPGSHFEDLDDLEAEYFSILPVELMENIFCQLPIVDLMLNCQRVCHKWYNVISSAQVALAVT